MSARGAVWSGIERRDPAGRILLRRRFHSEYQHFPGMSLTADQAARLFALPKDVCRRVFEELVEARVLSRQWEGKYVAMPSEP